MLLAIEALPAETIGYVIGFIALAVGLALLLLLAWGLAKGVVWLLDGSSTADEWREWFAAAGLPAGRVAVRGFPCLFYSRTHAKIVLADDDHAVVLGSPFWQRYFDSERTRSMSRGEARKPPRAVHDVSGRARSGGRPPAGIVQLHWNLADSGDAIGPPAGDAAPPMPTRTPESRSSRSCARSTHVQGGTEGENGVLEAYLRAIFAERFIYIENQYFNNEQITQALIDALAAKPALVVILLLNVVPDMPIYLTWQRALIRRWSRRPGNGGDAPRRVQHLGRSRRSAASRARDNYLHTKSASSTTAGPRWGRPISTARRSITSSRAALQLGHAQHRGQYRRLRRPCRAPRRSARCAVACGRSISATRARRES